MKTLLAFVVLAILAMALGLLIYLGAFKSVTITTAEAGPYKVVYKTHLGAFHKIVPDIEEVERWATSHGEACISSFGEYLDDPSIVDEDRLHSNGGCLVNGDWSGAGRLPEGLLYREITPRLYAIAEFDGAPSIGPQKVYPRVSTYLAAQSLKTDGPVIEIYERMPGAQLRTHYHFPVRK
jgi:AraC family transcriptional regulator